MTLRSDVRRLSWPLYVAIWLTIWAVQLTQPGSPAAVAAHWPIAVVMVLGSLVAGSMPIGGGAIAFPMLVLVMGHAPAMARDFALAIQSVGMTSALVFIASRRIPVAWPLVAWTTAGAAVGLTFGTFGPSLWLPAHTVKLVFATVWLAFAAGLVAVPVSVTIRPGAGPAPRAVRRRGLVIGVVGGTVAATLGMGVEMLVYAALVFGDRWSPRAAVPSAVCAMALAAPIGLALRAVATGVDPAVHAEWLASVPIVLFGAPAGAYLSTRLPQRLLVRCVALLCVVQFTATLVQVRPGPAGWLGVAALLLGTGTFIGRWLGRTGIIHEEVSNAGRSS